jgi:hypothetical protein
MKILMRLAIAGIMTCILYRPVMAQESNADKKIIYPNNIGAAGGFTTGYGLSYRRWFANGLGLQGTFFPYYMMNNDYTESRYSMGATGFKLISVTKYVNFYGYASMHHNVYDYTDKRTYTIPNQSMSNHNSMTAIGVGPGVDFKMAVDRFLTSLMIGVAYYKYSNETMINMTGEIAVYYSF